MTDLKIETLSVGESTEQPSNSLASKKLSVPFSQQIAETRTLLLKTMQEQLALPLAKQLKPQKENVPFVHVNILQPQVAAIQKVINSLYYAEETLKAWENLDLSTYMGMAGSVKQGVKGLTQIYNCLALLNDATPEIQALITNNFALLKPIFTQAYDIIQQSGWISQFNQMEEVNLANSLLAERVDLASMEQTNPLISIFTLLSQATDKIIDLHEKVLSNYEKQSTIKSLHHLLSSLNDIPLLQTYTLSNVQGSVAFKKLLECFANIGEDSTNITQQFMEQYNTWIDRYFSDLILWIDSLERQNYLKPGLLSQDLCHSVDQLRTVVNREKVSDNLLFTQMREEKISDYEIEQVKTIVKLENKMDAVKQFFTQLQPYRNSPFATIPESVRHELRQLYPQFQAELAHESLELENQLTQNLNEEGPEQDTSWLGWATGYAHYAKSFVLSSEVDQVLAKKEGIFSSLERQIEAEKLKMEVAKYAKLNLTGAKVKVKQRIEEIKKNLVDTSINREVVLPGELNPIQASSLKNLRGNIAYLQEMELSSSVNKTRTALATVLQQRLSSKQQAYFTQPPYQISATLTSFFNCSKADKSWSF